VPPPGGFGFHVERDDLDMAPFDPVAGLGRMFQLFGCQVDSLLTGLNELLAGCRPGFPTTSLMLQAACPHAAAARIRRVRAPGPPPEPLPRAIAGLALTSAFVEATAGVRADSQPRLELLSLS